MLAKKGNLPAIKFLRETKDFLEKGSCGQRCRGILAEHGDKESQKKYELELAAAREDATKRRRKRGIPERKEFQLKYRKRRMHADEDAEVMRLVRGCREVVTDASKTDHEDEDVVLSDHHDLHSSSTEDNGTAESSLGILQGDEQGFENADADEVRVRYLSGHQASTTQQRLANTESGTLGAVCAEQDGVTITSHTNRARKIKEEFQSPEVITIDDDDTVDSLPSNDSPDISLLYCEWEEKEAKAASKKAEMEIKKHDLETKMGTLQSQNIFRSEGKLQPATLDGNYKNEIELLVINADIVYYERLAAFARVYLSSIEQGQNTDADSPELRRITFEANKAYHDGRAAFAKLKRLFPATKNMERPVALEGWCA